MENDDEYEYGNNWIDIDTVNGINIDHVSISDSTQYSNTAVFPGDIKFHDKDDKTISLGETLNKINERLAIIEPDFEKMEQFPALRKAYEHYKTIEAMIRDDHSDQE